jgi:hypothetical protein
MTRLSAVVAAAILCAAPQVRAQEPTAALRIRRSS